MARNDMFAEVNGDRKDVQDMIVLLFGGKALLYTKPTAKEVRKTIDTGIHLLPIGIEVQ